MQFSELALTYQGSPLLLIVNCIPTFLDLALMITQCFFYIYEVVMYLDKAERVEFYHSKEWSDLRQQALARDNYECQWCKAEGRVSSGTLEVDHIKDLEHYPEHALDLDNLRTLCKDHHNQRHNRMKYSSKKHRKPPKWNDERWD